jgi:hypothetical protein
MAQRLANPALTLAGPAIPAADPRKRAPGFLSSTHLELLIAVIA